MPPYRSRTSTHGRNMAGARGLWRATGMKDGDFGKPIVAIANSFTQFVPGHVHLKDLGQLVAREIEAAGGVAKEFNTIAVDDGIAMGHDGMLYSLPSREIIADSVEYMANAHCADALVCISNCDKITPGMLMAALRLNIPAVFVSGGPMEAGKVKLSTGARSIDLIDAMVAAADSKVSDADVAVIERSACPTCGSCSGMFTANSMNCLTEALGLSLPGNGTVVATHADRRRLFVEAGHLVVDLARRWYEEGDEGALPRGIATFKAFENAMTLDIAMGGSTNTVLHLLAAAHEGEVDFTMTDIDRLSRRAPVLCKVAPSVPDVHVEDVHRAGGVMGILGELDRAGLLNRDVRMVHAESLEHALSRNDIMRAKSKATREFFLAAPGGVPTQVAFSQSARYPSLDEDRAKGVIRDAGHAFSKDGGLAVLYGNIALDGSIVKTAGVDASNLKFTGARAHLRKPGRRGSGNPERKSGRRRRRRHPLRRAARGAGMQEMLYPTSYLKSRGLGKACALVTDGRFSGGTSGLSIGHISPEAAEGGAIALIEEGDLIAIDIPARSMDVVVDDATLSQRRAAMEAKGEPPGSPRRSASARSRRRCGLTPRSRPAPRAGRSGKCHKAACMFKALSARSIASRLFLSAAFWSTLILVLAGLGLSAFNKRWTEANFDDQLGVYLKALVANVAIPNDEAKAGAQTAIAPQFELAFSGWYWQITRTDVNPPEIRASKSLFATQLPHLPAVGESGAILSGYVVGPGGHELRMIEREIDAGDEGRFLVQVAANADVIQGQERSFEWALAATFLTLALALIGSTALAVRFGLQAAPGIAGRGGRHPPRRGRTHRWRISAGRSAAGDRSQSTHRRQPGDCRARAHPGRQSRPCAQDPAQRPDERGRRDEPRPCRKRSASRRRSCAGR